MRQTLRSYQREAKEALRRKIADGRRRLVLVLPTGAGKTTIAASIIEDAVTRECRPNRVLFLAHRTELIDQCSARLDQFGLRAHGVIQSTHPRQRPYAPIQVASVQTMGRRRTVLNPPPALVISDECHRTLGRYNRKIIEDYPLAVTLGLTATPWRLDKRGLGRLFDDMVIGASYQELIAADYILEPRVLCPWRPELGETTLTRAGDYDADEIAELVDGKQRIDDVVNAWTEHAEGRRTVAFATSVAHSRHLVAAFRAAGVEAQHLDGETHEDVRRAMLRRLARGETQIISNYGVLAEGWDCPPAEVCILCRPSKSLSLYMQCVGRVLRPSPDTGKAGALILDHAGCSYEHGWPTATREWSLEDRPRAREVNEDDEPPVTICEQCLYVRPSPARGPCPECGYEPPPPSPRAPDLGESGVPMVEVARDEVERYLEHNPPSRRRGWPPFARAPRTRFNPGGWSSGQWRSS